jgi:cell division protease FtsH
MAKARRSVVTSIANAPITMGPLELAVYTADWTASRAYHGGDTNPSARARPNAGSGSSLDLPAQELKSGGAVDQGAKRPGAGFVAMRQSVIDHDRQGKKAERSGEAPNPGPIAARLLIARLFDSNPSIMERFKASAPVVLLDVADEALLSLVAHQWKDVLGLNRLKFANLEKVSANTNRKDYDAVCGLFISPMKPADHPLADIRAFAAVQLALPLIAITPSAQSHLSKVILDAATDRLVLPSIDAALITNVIQVVTGKTCEVAIPNESTERIGLHELIVGIRFDRTPAECVGYLLKLVHAKVSKAGSRDLSLDELHGLDEAVIWAKSTILDIEAWRRGEISWDSIDAGMVLNGPPGTGKTTFAKIFAAKAGLPLISATLAKWQGSGEGHLGHLLRAMKRDFDEARKSPCVMVVDELDSFGNRSEGGSGTSFDGYSVQVVNALLEQLDGLQGRQGLLFIGCSNDVRRCDPAIVRAGRLNRIINVQLPTPRDIEKMMRVRLRGDLVDVSIEEVALLAIGSTGADVERIVKDARRFARHDGRTLSIADLKRAVLGNDEEMSPEMLERAAVHEAGHIIVSVIQSGPEEIQAVIASGKQWAGFVASDGRAPDIGTLDEYRQEMQRLLAGRAAEEIELGAAGHGSAGATGSDLSRATNIAAALVGSFGHAGPHPLVFMADRFRPDVIMDHADLRAAAHKELAAAFDEAKRILAKHQVALRKVARLLLEQGRVNGHDVHEVIVGSRHQTCGSRGLKP